MSAPDPQGPAALFAERATAGDLDGLPEQARS
jgi:hypothetical protein